MSQSLAAVDFEHSLVVRVCVCALEGLFLYRHGHPNMIRPAYCMVLASLVEEY